MENRLRFVLKPSLEEMALRRVVVSLWSETDILSPFLFESVFYMLCPHCEERKEIPELFEIRVRESVEWREAVGKVQDKVLKLELPKSLKTHMMPLVKPIGYEMLRGLIFFQDTLVRNPIDDWNMNLLKQLRWTSTGAVDYERTAENVVNLEMLNIVKRYKLACLNFVVNRLPLLWKELPGEYKSDEMDALRDRSTHYEYYWFCILMEVEFEVDSPSIDQRGFEYAAVGGNRAGVEYHFQRLTNEERDSSLFTTTSEVITQRFASSDSEPRDFPLERNSNVLFYLLSVMTSEEQMRILQKYTFALLKCLLDWPWQDLFLDVADVVWTFLPEISYMNLLNNINQNMKFSGYYFPDIFQNFFLRSPQNFRESFVKFECLNNCFFFSEFFKVKDEETIKVVLRNIDVESRVKLVSSFSFFRILDGLIMENKWDLVKLCLREASESLESRERVKKVLMRFATEILKDPVVCREGKWKELFESLDRDDLSARRKRRLEDETLTKVKKLCNEVEKNDLLKN